MFARSVVLIPIVSSYAIVVSRRPKENDCRPRGGVVRSDLGECGGKGEQQKWKVRNVLLCCATFVWTQSAEDPTSDSDWPHGGNNAHARREADCRAVAFCASGTSTFQMDLEIIPTWLVTVCTPLSAK